ncbi:GerW family sporulation protein [Clostridium sp. CM028]|uniref:GerW family sporulation protein n=1 Tax=unclassified Clostridium TaxID=2614128 RepID=UPI001C0C881C|nr:MULTISPECIES: GerW family sporulation protein [unclassified Clostridium]MBU3091572.1 GerW family sporulation protein [Clostridium sp. CF011]MBW9144163.1 GerW family sporulation protein [Clostridium sp. CM027]MBW9147526.1 GerW family sporulation protein [Clostridium sp. CM028]UVE41194.1 GerW family sporulation protein [Clostridium sp. CM027]WAG70190.1 GerW family sporulation protein [Clostridium sp. CF011]
MDNHPIENLMRSTMESIKDMIDVNTIVGEPIQSLDGTTIIPISRVCFGFASGGSEFNSVTSSDSSNNYPFGGGSGAGVTVKPVAFLVVKNDSVRLLPVDQQNTYDKIVDTVPQVIDIIKGMFKDSCDKNTECEDSDKYSE